MIGKLSWIVLLLPLLALAQSPEEADEAALAQKAEAVRAREQAIREKERELRAIEKELQGNVMELIELEREVDPNVRQVIRRALVFGDRPVLGISIGTRPDEDRGVSGVTVLGVTPGGPADEAGIRSGDLIVAFNSESLAAESGREAEARLLAGLDDSEAGRPVMLGIERDGKKLEIEVTPRVAMMRHMAVPHAPGAPLPPRGRNVELLMHGAAPVDFMLSDAQRHWAGIELVELTPDLGRYFGTDAGLLVVRKPAKDAMELEEGDVIMSIGGREPKSVSHAMRILRSYDAGESLDIEVMRDKRRLRIDITIPDQEQQ